jgi:CHAT domain-containing protein
VDILEFLGSNVFVDDVMLRFSADRPDAYLRLVALSDDARAAFRYLQLFRSRILPGPKSTSDNESLSSEVSDLRRRLRASYLELLQKPGASGASIIDRIRNDEQRLADRIREHRIAHDLPRTAPHVLDDDTEDRTIVEYLISDGAVEVFVCRRGEAHRIRLKATAQELERQVAFFRHYLMSRKDGLGLDRYLRQIYAQILSPIEELLDERVVFVPDGCLRDVPFHALRAPWGTVVDRFTVWYAPTAGACRNTRQRQPDNLSVLIGLESPGIPSVQKELHAVARQLPNPIVWTGSDVAKLPDAFSRAAFIHITSHGVFRRDDPSFSMLLLGSDVLTPVDLAGMAIQAELVTMSACSTGRALTPGFEGFCRAFLLLGVPSLIGSLWDVEDSATALLMDRFYSNLSQSPDLAAALRQAMLALKAQNEHPYYWAGFVLIGNAVLQNSWKFFRDRRH